MKKVTDLIAIRWAKKGKVRRTNSTIMRRQGERREKERRGDGEGRRRLEGRGGEEKGREERTGKERRGKE
jgi:hypothetical protein